MLQQDQPDDYVIATGEQHSVREFVQLAADILDIPIRWEGRGVDEIGIRTDTGCKIVAISPRYFRPTEVETLLGDAGKARKNLGWVPKIGFETLVREMVESDLEQAQKYQVITSAGYRVCKGFE